MEHREFHRKDRPWANTTDGKWFSRFVIRISKNPLHSAAIGGIRSRTASKIVSRFGTLRVDVNLRTDVDAGKDLIDHFLGRAEVDSTVRY